MRAPENPWRRHCPVCPDGEFPLPMWEWKRRRERRCPSCDAQIEFVVPALAYYAFHGGGQIMAALAAPAVIFVFFAVSPRWALILIVALLALLVGLTLLSNYLFGRFVVLRSAEDVPSGKPIYRRRFGD